MTYASYIKTKDNLARETLTIAISDFGVAFTAGLFVFPIIFHFGLQDAIGLGGTLNTDSTVGTLFIAIPPALLSITGGQWVVAAFFIMLFFAALTSAISLLEVVVSAVIDSWNWERKKATLVFGGAVAVAGLASAVNLNVLDFLDKLVGTVLLMFGGLMTAILVGYKILPQADAELAKGMDNEGYRKAWAGFVRYVAPPVLLTVLIFSIPKVWTAFKTLVGM
jgi:NSS family neurotransmitter:Na+ symporter